MRATVSKWVEGRWVPFIRTNLVDIAYRRYLERKERGEPVRIDVEDGTTGRRMFE